MIEQLSRKLGRNPKNSNNGVNPQNLTDVYRTLYPMMTKSVGHSSGKTIISFKSSEFKVLVT